MARPRKDGVITPQPLPPALAAWAEAIGDAIGRGVVRAINDGMANLPVSNGNGQAPTARRRGRPPKAVSGGGAVPVDRRCTADNCGREARSKGLCSAHYQAERRRTLASAKSA